ncbi:asparagine synthase (glutamine-hydrolyzing) [soil metagenome]
MCGIAGIASAHTAPDPDLVRRMRDTLTHRGPDDAGLWSSPDGCVVLGHRRLSIIDLSLAGHQPMTDASGDCHLVFNGEIYNFQEIRDLLQARGHRFRSTCDTEVLLEAYHAWGTDCLSRLNGMFAFALYDTRHRQLFAARDRAGEKPFFYTHADGRLAFGSELKALMADPAVARRVDAVALETYLAFGFVPHDGCILRGVRKLPPAHALVYDLAGDQLRTWQYWRLPEPAPDRACDEQALIEELEQHLLDSVRLRLIADVPVGIMLSGGVDSSLVTAMAARLVPRIKTFTISFPGHGSFDEAPFARTVAQHFSTDHVVLAAEPATVDLLPELARQYDEPLADSSMVPTAMVSRLIRQEATVALGGDGGDELFGGYPHHSWVQSQARLRRLIPAAAAPWLRGGMSAALPIGFRGRNYLLGLTGDQRFALGQFNQLFDSYTRRRLLGAPAPGSVQPELFKTSLAPRRATPLQQATAIDFRSYLPDDILAKVDRASMLHSLEVRAPFLDHRLVEFAFRLPDDLRATAAERKILTRRLAERLLPASMDLTRKQGFSLPLDAWFGGEWGSFTRQVLTDPGQTTFDQGVVASLLAGQKRGLVNVHRLFALTMFELWRREYRVTVS